MATDRPTNIPDDVFRRLLNRQELLPHLRSSGATMSQKTYVPESKICPTRADRGHNKQV